MRWHRALYRLASFCKGDQHTEGNGSDEGSSHFLTLYINLFVALHLMDGVSQAQYNYYMYHSPYSPSTFPNISPTAIYSSHNG